MSRKSPGAAVGGSQAPRRRSASHWDSAAAVHGARLGRGRRIARERRPGIYRSVPDVSTLWTRAVTVFAVRVARRGVGAWPERPHADHKGWASAWLMADPGDSELSFRAPHGLVGRFVPDGLANVGANATRHGERPIDLAMADFEAWGDGVFSR